jgi:hypothetical protein
MNLINYKIIELSELKFSLYKVQKFLLNLGSVETLFLRYFC